MSLRLINQFGSISLWFIGRLTIKDSRPSLEFFTCQLQQNGVYETFLVDQRLGFFLATRVHKLTEAKYISFKVSSYPVGFLFWRENILLDILTTLLGLFRPDIEHTTFH